MRIVLILAATLLIGVPSADAQAVGTAPSVIQDRSYKLLREDEDWSFLRDRSLREDFWDPIKYTFSTRRTLFTCGRVDLGNIAAGELNEGCFTLVGSVGRN